MKIFGFSTILLLADVQQGFAARAPLENAKGSIRQFRPIRVDFDDIVKNTKDPKNGSRLLEALQDVGMVSVTNMPESFRRYKQETLAWTHACALQSDSMKDHVFSDGATRRTMATHTIRGPGGMQDVQHGSAANVEACRSFTEASRQFRQMVDSVTTAFAIQLSDLLEDGMAESSLLQSESGFEFKTVLDVVENGEHLEHFHSYQKSSPSSLDEDLPSVLSSDSTIEWHTDQGLFLVFTPGVRVQQRNVLDETEGFYIELGDGTKAHVQFQEDDDLVIMLGDGVNQYVNPNLKSSKRKLRAVPHALAMSRQGKESDARVWYGRMILPPASAVHPVHKESFGQLRKLLIDASTSSKSPENDDVLSLGCSSPSMHARQLETSLCEEGTLHCWHRCMSLEEHGVSEDICSEQGLDLWCINPRSQLWDNTHGDL